MPWPFTPGKYTRYPLYRMVGMPQGPSGRMRKISPHPNSATQPVASPAIPAHVPVKCPIFLSHFNIFGYSQQMVIKVSSIKFHENPSCGSQVCLYSCMRTDGWTDGPAWSNRNKLSLTVPTRLKRLFTLHCVRASLRHLWTQCAIHLRALTRLNLELTI